MSKTNLYILPIEPLEERYTAEWYRYLPQSFEKQGFVVKQIDGRQVSGVITTGAFLDMNDTIVYKTSQLATVAGMFKNGEIKAGDTFFVSDVEFWGIESLRLMSQLNKVPIKIFGFLHAASYTKEDAFAVAAPYQKYTELGWIAACDGIFVGSQYHRQAVIERRINPYAAGDERFDLAQKIRVTGNPLWHIEETTEGWLKQNKLVITNRFDIEKRPQESLNFAYLLKKRNPDLKIVVTTSRPEFRSNQQWLVDLARGMEADGIIEIAAGLSKREYHNHLKTAKVMLTNSIEENFGYCIVEAMKYGCSPLMPNTCSHPEFVDGNQHYLFNSPDEIIPKAERLLEEPSYSFGPDLERFYYAPEYMANIMRRPL